MNASRHSSRSRQQGMVTVLAVLFLITAVIFALSQTFNITGSNSIDNSRQMDSTNALFLAESGLERARGSMDSSWASGTQNNSSCSGISAGGLCGTGIGSGSFSLGTGRSFCYNSASSIPATCTGGACTGCDVRVTGTAGSASRTLNLRINLTSDNGVTGFGGCPSCVPATNPVAKPITMTLRNTFGVPATVMFNLAWRRLGGTAGQTVAGGNASAFECTLEEPDCNNQWHVESSSGNPSVGSMGVSVFDIAAGLTATVEQTLDKNRNYAQVGAWFPGPPGAPAAPAIMGSYWKDSGGSGRTVNNSNATPSSGETNSGVATATVPSNCLSATNSTNTSQTCTSWCNGADTLVFGVSARSDETTVANQITNVIFNTNDSTSQNFPLTRIAHFPNADGTTRNATGDIYSEIWKAYNPNYLSTNPANSAGATSYQTAVKGTIGATITLSSNILDGSSTMVVASLADSNSRICLGDIIAGSNRFQANTTISSPSGCNGATTYTLSLPVTGNINTNVNPIASSATFIVQGQTGANLANGSTNTAGVNIASGPDSGNNYTLTARAFQPTTTIITHGSSGATITVPSDSPVPTLIPTTPTIVAVYFGSDTGQFPAGTTVLATTTTPFKTFTVSPAPTVPLVNAVVCGGICALFNAPSLTTSFTQFTVTRSASTTQWAGGFTCLSGVDDTRVRPVTSSSTTASTWSEMVQ